MSEERWLPVVGWEGYYEVSDQGHVRSVDRVDATGKHRKSRVLNPSVTHGHSEVSLSTGTKKQTGCRVHRLVLEAFVGLCPEGMECCHYNDIGTDNRLENLRWDTHSANEQDKVRNGNHLWANKTHCPQGHKYTEANIEWTTDGRRRCRTCRNEQSTARYRAVTGYYDKYPEGWPDKCCKHGHEYTPENTYWRTDGKKECRTCRKARSAKHKVRYE